MNEKDSKINMQSIFDGEKGPHKKLSSGGSEVVKKLSFQLGCQSQDEDMQITRSAAQDDQQLIFAVQANSAVAVAIDNTRNIDRNQNQSQSQIQGQSNEEVHITPVPRHQYNKNHLVLSNQVDKEDLERENEMIYDSLRSRRRYQLWRGHNVFLCYGRIMLGVHIGHLTLSISLITGKRKNILKKKSHECLQEKNTITIKKNIKSY
jgi:hypothetical protein